MPSHPARIDVPVLAEHRRRHSFSVHEPRPAGAAARLARSGRTGNRTGICRVERCFFVRISRCLPVLLLIAQVLATAPASADELLVKVVDDEGVAVPGVAVVVEHADAEEVSARSHPDHAVMDQRDERFVPALLVVRTGTIVEFPNSDDVMHHVYSFSPARTFEIPLYQHRPPSPVHFDEPGLVVLGCNIHDQMIGHILVVDSPYFGVTDEHGTVRIDHRAAGGTLLVWHPDMGGIEHAVRRPADAQIEEVQLAAGHRPPPSADGALSWDDY